MKNIITIILFLPLTIFSQETLETYEIFGKELNMQATEPDGKGYTLYLDGYALDKTVSKGGLMIKSKKIEDFKNAWEEAKLKYIEWTATAKAKVVAPEADAIPSPSASSHSIRVPNRTPLCLKRRSSEGSPLLTTVDLDSSPIYFGNEEEAETMLESCCKCARLPA